MTFRLLLVLPLLLLFAPTGAARAQEIGGLLEVVEGLFGGRPAAAPRLRITKPKPVRVLKKDVDPAFVNMYTPFVTKVLTSELHFVQKVCEPTDEEFDEIHRAGLLAVAATSKHYEELQKIRQAAGQWPKPQVQITESLQEAIDKILTPEQAERYREEIAARVQAERDAAAGMVLVHIDEALLLTPKQHEQMGETIKEKWNTSWSSGPRLFMYPQYAQLPGTSIVGKHLTARQKAIWTQRSSNNVSVSFGWQMELGLQDWIGGAELEAFEKPSPAEPDADDASLPQHLPFLQA